MQPAFVFILHPAPFIQYLKEFSLRGDRKFVLGL